MKIFEFIHLNLKRCFKANFPGVETDILETQGISPMRWMVVVSIQSHDFSCILRLYIGDFGLKWLSSQSGSADLDPQSGFVGEVLNQLAGSIKQAQLKVGKSSVLSIPISTTGLDYWFAPKHDRSSQHFKYWEIYSNQKQKICIIESEIQLFTVLNIEELDEGFSLETEEDDEINFL